MNSFYSSLIINSKNFPRVHQVFRPRYNKEFFKRISANIELLEAQIDLRCKSMKIPPSKQRLRDLRNYSKKLVYLKENLEKLHNDDPKHEKIMSEIELIEDRIMPTVTKIPNRLSRLVPSEDVVVEEIKSNFLAKQNLAKVLSHRKLSYINNCYFKSVIGPNSHYYVGIGAKLQHALSEYFTSNLQEEGFVLVSGLCITKSAVIEATNTSDNKEFFNDPNRILIEDNQHTTLHLSESSREALVALLTTIGPIKSNNPLRLMTTGAGYKVASDWFDGDNKRVTQYETLNTLTLNSSIEQYSMKEYDRTKNVIWSSFARLNLPTRLVHCSADSMFANEYDCYKIEAWLPSRNEWIQVARISHYLDYITIRVGMKRGHMVDANVFDGQVLVAAVMENKQTSSGKFLIPDVLKDHSIFLSKQECDSYFSQPNSKALLNYQQKRFLTKRNYPFGHSRKAHELHISKSSHRDKRMLIFVFLLIFLVIDWYEFWYDYMPDVARRFIYDYLFRPVRRVWWSLIYAKGRVPVDLPYDKLDSKEYERTAWDRKREKVMLDRGRNPDGSISGNN